MTPTPDPVWPVLVLAAVQVVDAVFCIGPVPFVRRCLENVRFPRAYWRYLTPLKLAAVTGLVAGIWLPYLGLLTSGCLVAYFVVAITMHVRARDFGGQLFLNASGMLILCGSVTYVSFF